jgi:Uma2 family endonuclease
MKRMGLPAKKGKKAYTYAQYLSWPDEERWELIDGVAYDMSAAPNRRHQEIVMAISSEIFQFLKDKPCRVYAAPFDVRLAEGEDRKDDEIYNVVQPDISVFCRDDVLDERGGKGAPDLVIEVLSPRTSVKDQREKLELYERFGVKEYWIVDPQNHMVTVQLVDSGEYDKPVVYGPQDTIKCAILEGFSLDLGDILGSP